MPRRSTVELLGPVLIDLAVQPLWAMATSMLPEQERAAQVDTIRQQGRNASSPSGGTTRTTHPTMWKDSQLGTHGQTGARGKFERFPVQVDDAHGIDARSFRLTPTE